MNVDIVASAEIITGVTTNRVKVKKPRRRRQVIERRFHQDPLRPSGFKQVCISVSPEDLAVIDELAARLKMSRSRLLVVAVLKGLR